MGSLRRSNVVVVGVLAALVALVAASCGVPIGDLGGARSTAFGVNDAGLIVGTSALPGSSVEHAFKREPDGTIVDLGTLPGAVSSAAAAVNGHGEVAGTATFAAAWPSGPSVHLVRWDADGTIHDLGLLGGTDAMVRGIDDDGRIVGFTSTGSDEWAFVHDPAGGAIEPLPGLADSRHSAAYGMNDAGDAVGYQRVGDDQVATPVVWDLDAGTVTDVSAVWGVAALFDINDAGVIVGLKRYGTSPADQNDAAIGRPGSTDVERLGIGPFAIATEINDDDTVVGYVPEGSGCVAFRWDPGIGRRDLAPGAVSFAWSISDRGQIAGQLDGHAAVFASPPVG